MSTVSAPMTAEKLARMSDTGTRQELVDGELRMMSPAGNMHGQVAMRLAWRLAQFVEQRDLGAVFAAETGFLLASDPDTVRAPDVAFVNRTSLEENEDVDGYLPLAPDLVVEVVSPSDTRARVVEKTQAWLDAGSRLVLVVDSGTRTVTAYRSRDNVTILDESDTIDASDVVEGWTLPVGEVFP